MGRIHILEKSLYELIAAGEVVDRPSAIVKEMVENSIDAKASKIVVEIKDGGKTYIRITDNGSGMLPEDVPLAFVRHATSKIEQKEDLDSISTLGFRGEALASVCAVAKVEVLTKLSGEQMGWSYIIEASEEKKSEPAGCPDGTTFIIRDIFYNVPARYRYMKKDVTEGNSIAAVLQKLALSHPEISFKFIRDNKTEFVTSGDGKLLSCIYTIFGKEFYASCIPLDYEYSGIHVTGYITKPLHSKANRSYQNFFVNSRYVKSTTCMFAIEEGYSGRMMTGKYPGCVVRIDIDPCCVDVNAHPTKLEIRFQDEKSIYNAVYFAVKNALLLNDSPEEIKLDKPSGRNEEFTASKVYKPAEPQQEVQQMSLSTPTAEYKSDGTTFVSIKESMQSFMADYVPTNKAKVLKEADDEKSDIDSTAESGSSFDGFRYINAQSVKKNEERTEQFQYTSTASDDIIPKIQVIGEAFKTYIVAQCGDDILLIDKHAAHERLIYENIKSSIGNLDMQMLVERVNTNLSYEAYDAISNNPDACERIGLGVTILEAPYVSIYGVPTIADNMDPSDILNRLAHCLIYSKRNKGMEMFDDLYHTMACKAAIKAHSDTDKIELERLVELRTRDDLRYCPHGRPILVKLTKREIEKMFRRLL